MNEPPIELAAAIEAMRTRGQAGRLSGVLLGSAWS
jgi:hypothetical protein